MQSFDSFDSLLSWPSAEWSHLPMSVVVALPGQGEIVVAADTFAFTGSDGGYYGSRRAQHKIQTISKGGYALGITGTQIGFELHSRLKPREQALSGDVQADASDYANWTADEYRRNSYQGDASFLLCGVRRGAPFLYTWSFPKFSGAIPGLRWAAIGTKEHGALYLANSYHNDKMNRHQLTRLAYFSVSEVANHDPRVEVPVDVAVVTEGAPPRFLSPRELKKLKEESAKISAILRSKLQDC